MEISIFKIILNLNLNVKFDSFWIPTNFDNKNISLS